VDAKSGIQNGLRKARRDAFGQATARLQQASGAAVSEEAEAGHQLLARRQMLFHPIPALGQPSKP